MKLDDAVDKIRMELGVHPFNHAAVLSIRRGVLRAVEAGLLVVPSDVSRRPQSASQGLFDRTSRREVE